MQARRTTTLFLAAAAAVVATVAACGRSREPDPDVAARAMVEDSLSLMRAELAEQTVQAAMFVNEINKELAKARSLTTGSQKPLRTPSELAEMNAERNLVLTRITQLVEQLDASRGRLAGLRKQVADKDSALSSKIAEYEAMVAETNLAADRQRAELEAVIEGQHARIATLSGRVDTLLRTKERLEAERSTAYVVVGTREELVRKGVLVPEGPRRFLFVGSRGVEPARDLDPAAFVKIDSRTDSTIFLPDGVYKIVSRQDAAFATPQAVKDGKIAGALKIEQPERFWSTSRFLILMRS